MTRPKDEALLSEQIEYYRARAPEYDEWWLRQGNHDFGEDANQRWRADIDQLRVAFDEFAPAGDVLELAAGTGGWTIELARHADSITAVDASGEALALNRQKLHGSPTVEYVEADLFSWRPDRRYDVVFFSFWLSHVPPSRFDEFWEIVGSCLAREGRFFMIDNARPRERDWLARNVTFSGATVQSPTSTTDLEAGTALRKLNDGRSFQIVKVYWTPPELEARLASIGWRAAVRETDWAFVYGYGARAN